MEKRRVIDKRTVRLESVTRTDFIPFFGGRPDRVTVINAGDITDLRIALNTSKTMEELLAVL